jgi:putative ABC transport system ATP-binding protein
MVSETQQSAKSPLIQIQHLSFAVQGKQILEDITLEINQGERLALFGPSGAGKSTLIRLLNRLDEPTGGTILMNGQEYREIPPGRLRRRLGMVMQQPYLFPGTVAENLRFGPEAHGETLDDEAIESLLAGVDLAGFADREVSKLSGGEAQRVNLARTLANRPQVLMLDEPTSSLDAEARREVEETILSVIENGDLTCILVSHDEDQARRMTDRVALLKEGRLTHTGTVEEVFHAD